MMFPRVDAQASRFRTTSHFVEHLLDNTFMQFPLVIVEAL